MQAIEHRDQDKCVPVAKRRWSTPFVILSDIERSTQAGTFPGPEGLLTGGLGIFHYAS